MEGLDARIAAGQELERRGKLNGRQIEILRELESRMPKTQEVAQTPPNQAETASGPSFMETLGQAASRASDFAVKSSPMYGPAAVAGAGGKEINSQIQDKVVGPLVRGGYEKTGGAIGTASELTFPKTPGEGLAFLGTMGPAVGQVTGAAMKAANKLPILGADVAENVFKVLPGGRIPFEAKKGVQAALKNIGEKYKKFVELAAVRDVKVDKVTGAKGYGRAKSITGDVIHGSIKKDMKDSKEIVDYAYGEVRKIADTLPESIPMNLLETKANLAQDLEIYGKGAGDASVISTVKDLDRGLYEYVPELDTYKRKFVSVGDLIDIEKRVRDHAYEPASKNILGKLNRRGKMFLKLSEAIKKDIATLKSEELDKAFRMATDMASHHFATYGSDTVQTLLNSDKKKAVSTIFESRTTAQEAKAAMHPKAWDYAANKRSDEILAAIQKSDDPIGALNQATHNDAEEAISILGKERYLRLQAIADLQSKVKLAEKELEEAGKRIVPQRRANDKVGYKLADMRKSDAGIVEKSLNFVKNRPASAVLTSAGVLSIAMGSPVIAGLALAFGVAPEVMARVYVSASGTHARTLFYKAALAVGTPAEKAAIRALTNAIPRADRPKKKLSNVMPSKSQVVMPAKEDMVQVTNIDTNESKLVPKSAVAKLGDSWIEDEAK